MTINRHITIILILLISLSAIAQNGLSGSVPTDNYGLIRTNIDATYNRSAGNISDHFKARASFELTRKKHITVTANGHYNLLRCDFDESDVPIGYDPYSLGMNGTHHSGQFGITTSVNTTLLNKHVVTFAMLSADYGNQRFQRVSGVAIGIIMLRANRNTQFGIGPIVLINSTSRIPAFLIFIYRHRFNNLLSLNLYGTMFGLDYTPTRNDLFTVGGDIDVKSFYFKPNRPDLPHTCRYGRTSFRPIVKYKRRFFKNFYGELQTGISLKMSSRINGVTGSKRYFEVKTKPRLFIQAELSYSI